MEDNRLCHEWVGNKCQHCGVDLDTIVAAPGERVSMTFEQYKALTAQPSDAAATNHVADDRNMVDRTSLVPTEAPAVDAPSAFQSLQEALLADQSYAWSWHCNLAMPIMDSIHCTSEQANKAGADLMQYLFGIDVRKFKEWHHDEPKPAVDALTTGTMDDPMDVLLGRLKSGGDYAAPLYTAKQGNEPKILTREGLAVLVDHHKAHDGSVDSFELADSFIALMAHPAPSPKAPAPSVEQPLTDPEMNTLVINKARDVGLRVIIDSKMLNDNYTNVTGSFPSLVRFACALLQSAHAAGGQS